MNVLLLKAWLNSNASSLIGARLAEVRQVDLRTFVLRLTLESAQQELLVSILEEYPILAETTGIELPDADPAPDCNFVKALRFHLSGFQLMSIVQPGFERSVSFTFSQRDMYGRTTVKVLTVELAGRSSNAYLITSQRMVISIFKRVRHGQNRVRHVMTGKMFPDPPPLGKYIASESGVEALADELARYAAGSDQEPSDALEELFSRRAACGDVKLWPRLSHLLPVEYTLDSLHAFVLRFQRGELTPELFDLGSEGRSANSVALETWLAARGSRSMKGQNPVAKSALLTGRITQLQEQRDVASRADELEQDALEMLRTAEETDKPGVAAAYLQAWAVSHPDWAQRLNPERSVYDNAQGLLHLAQRLKRGADKLDGVIAGTQSQIEALDAAGESQTPVKALPDPHQKDFSRLRKLDLKYLRFQSTDGIPILCGVSDRSNDGLLRAFGSARHLWFHARDYPGSHVILLSNGADAPRASIEQAAVVAAYHSQGRGETELDVSYLPMKHLRRPKDAKPGQVLKMSEKVIRVRPALFEELRNEIYHNTQG